MGASTGTSITTGDDNTLIGGWAGEQVQLNANTYIGRNCGRNGSTGSNNTYVGYFAGDNANKGNSNIAMGSAAGYSILTPTFSGTPVRNISFGTAAGRHCMKANSTDNILIGTSADLPTTIINSTAISNAIAIGANTVVTASNSMILGNNTARVGIGLSGNATPPGNNLEINATNAVGSPLINTSGLKFRQLTANSPTVANTGNMGVLALDLNGNVIYVPGGGSAIGTCTMPTVLPSATNGNIQLNGNNFYFENGPAAGTNAVSIGYVCSAPLGAKLDVVENSGLLNATGIRTISNNGGRQTGIYAEVNNSTNTFPVSGQIAINGRALNATTGSNIGGSFMAQGSGAITNYGIDCSGSGSSNQNIGGRFVATGFSPTSINYGILSDATSVGANLNIAGEFSCNGGTTNFGVRATAPVDGVSRAGKFNGDLEYTGSLIPSDIMFKENIQNISNASQILDQIQPHTFTYKPNNSLNFSQGVHYGVIAQELELVLPELVKSGMNPAKYDSSGNLITAEINYKTADYISLIPILIQGFKEQQAQIAALQGGGSKTTENNNLPSTNVELASENAMLWQNFPNPFGDGTVIRYFVPEKTAQAIIVFNDEFGNEIKTLELPNKGMKAELNISTSNLAAGIYSYSLVVDGKITATKNMVKAK